MNQVNEKKKVLRLHQSTLLACYMYTSDVYTPSPPASPVYHSYTPLPPTPLSSSPLHHPTSRSLVSSTSISRTRTLTPGVSSLARLPRGHTLPLASIEQIFPVSIMDSLPLFPHPQLSHFSLSAFPLPPFFFGVVFALMHDLTLFLPCIPSSLVDPPVLSSSLSLPFTLLAGCCSRVHPRYTSVTTPHPPPLPGISIPHLPSDLILLYS